MLFIHCNEMTINHLVLIGGGHTNALLMRKWLMYPKLMPEIPISIISRDTHLVYSAMFPSVIAKSISFLSFSIEDKNFLISLLIISIKTLLSLNKTNLWYRPL